MRYFLFIITCLCLSVQVHAKKPPLTTLYLSLPDQVVKCHVIGDKKGISAKENLVYYWYAHNAVFQTQGGFDGRILHGDYRSFYLNNQLKEQGHFYKGLKHKTWTSWNEAGKIREIHTWKKGILNGTHKVYNDQGELVLEESIKNGMLNGKQMAYEHGKLKSTKVFVNGKEKEIKPKSTKKTTAKTDSTATEKKPKQKTSKTKKAENSDVKPADTASTEKAAATKTKKPFLQTVKGWFSKKDKTTKKPKKESSSPSK